MKLMKALWMMLSLFACCQVVAEEDGSAKKDDAAQKIPWAVAPQVRVQVEYIDVSQELFTELMLGAGAQMDDTQLRAKLAELIKQNKASVLETLLCTVRSGQKGSTDSVEDFTYPTEYEPATLPKQPDAKSNKNQEPATDVAIGPQPTAFEPRNIGSMLQVEPTVSDGGKIIDLRVEPEIVYHTGNQVWAEWKGTQGDSPVQTQKFYVMRISTAVLVENGKPMLLAAQTPKDEKGQLDRKRKLMVFVRADVIQSKT
jgi:hypothetical protein